jgi:hypothetical protein
MPELRRRYRAARNAFAMTDSQRWRQLDVPNYAEIKWLLHRNFGVAEGAESLSFDVRQKRGFLHRSILFWSIGSESWSATG